jgi:hypothetical protein
MIVAAQPDILGLWKGYTKCGCFNPIICMDKMWRSLLIIQKGSADKMMKFTTKKKITILAKDLCPLWYKHVACRPIARRQT